MGQSISHCPLLVFGAARFSRFPLPAARQTSLQTLPHRSPGSGQEVTDFQSSNGRHRNNKSSIHRHLISVAILHGVFQEIIVEFRKKRKLVSFVCEDVQFEIHKVFLNVPQGRRNQSKRISEAVVTQGENTLRFPKKHIV